MLITLDRYWFKMSTTASDSFQDTNLDARRSCPICTTRMSSLAYDAIRFVLGVGVKVVYLKTNVLNAGTGLVMYVINIGNTSNLS